LTTVCQQNIIKVDIFSELFKSCKKSLTEAAQKGTEDIDLDPNEQSIDYYAKAI
jgi:hypothetical protein